MKRRSANEDSDTAAGPLQALSEALAALGQADEVRAFLEDLCTPAELVAYDLWAWRTLVHASLPATDVNIFLAAGETVPEDRRQLGVMISWRENERDNDTAYKNPISTSTDGGTVSCPADRTCHLQYIPVSARCAPYLMGGTPQYFCPGAKL